MLRKIMQQSLGRGNLYQILVQIWPKLKLFKPIIEKKNKLHTSGALWKHNLGSSKDTWMNKSFQSYQAIISLKQFPLQITKPDTVPIDGLQWVHSTEERGSKGSFGQPGNLYP